MTVEPSAIPNVFVEKPTTVDPLTIKSLRSREDAKDTDGIEKRQRARTMSIFFMSSDDVGNHRRGVDAQNPAPV